MFLLVSGAAKLILHTAIIIKVRCRFIGWKKQSYKNPLESEWEKERQQLMEELYAPGFYIFHSVYSCVLQASGELWKNGYG